MHTYPEFLSESIALRLGSIYIAPVYTATLIISIIFLVLFGLFFKKSAQGIYMRSVADNQKAALSLGVHVRRVFALSWAIAALVAEHERYSSRNHQRCQCSRFELDRLKSISRGNFRRAGQYRRRDSRRYYNRPSGNIYRRLLIAFID